VLIVDHELASPYSHPMRTKQGSYPEYAPAKEARLKEDTLREIDHRFKEDRVVLTLLALQGIPAAQVARKFV
jgi:hypothetical protein